LPLTGSGAVYGGGMRTVMEIAVEEINAAGGIMGRPVELVIEDDGTNADQGVRAAGKLINVDHVDTIIGTWASGVTLAVAPLTIEANIIMMVESGADAISELEDNNTIFRIGSKSSDTGGAVARYFLEKGLTNAIMLADSGDAADSQVQGFQRTFTTGNGTITDTIRYEPKLSSYATEVGRVLQSGAEAVALFCFTEEAIPIVREVYEAGTSALWGAPRYCVNEQVVDEVGPEAVEGWFVVDSALPSDDTPGFADLAKEYKNRTGENLLDNSYAQSVYDGVLTWALAAELANSTDGADVGSALQTVTNQPGTTVSTFAEGVEALRSSTEIDYDGLTGISFDENGDTPPLYAAFKLQQGAFVFDKIVIP